MKLSVIIPTHNRVDLLSRAIKSVQDQTISDIEIIVVSDGSTDGTDELMKSLSEKDERIRYYYYSPAKGGNYARNWGIQKSTADFVVFLDDDDVWLPTKLEEQLAVVNSSESIGLVYTGINAIYVNEGVTYSSLPSKTGDLSKEILLSNYIGSTSTVLIRKSVFEKAGVFDEELKALQDYDLWIRIAQVTEIGAVKKELVDYYNYRGGKGQVSSVTSKYEEAFQHINKKYETLLANLSPEQRVQKLVFEKFLLGNKAMRNNDPRTARSYFRSIMDVKFNLKALIYYFLTFTNFKTVLKFRTLKK